MAERATCIISVHQAKADREASKRTTTVSSDPGRLVTSSHCAGITPLAGGVMEASATPSTADGFPDGWFSALVLATVFVATAFLWRWDAFGGAWRFFVLFNVRLQHFSSILGA